MTSTDEVGGDVVDDPTADERRSVGVGGWLLRVIGLVAVVAGVVIGVLGWLAIGEAADDEEATAAIDAEREEVAAQLAAKEQRRTRRLDRITAEQAAVRELQGAVNALSMTHSGFFDDADGPLFEQAVTLWNAGDHAGAVAVLDAEVAPTLVILRDRLGQMELAETEVATGARRLSQP